MRGISVMVAVGVAVCWWAACNAAGSGDTAKPAKYVVGSGPARKADTATAVKTEATKAPKKAGTATASVKADGAKATRKARKADTVKVVARVIEIPGTFPPNDLYNYVYVMKYRVMKVLSGTCAEQEILVGHYNPLIPRKQIKDKMDPFVDGDVEKFEVGGKHSLVLVRPVDLVWSEAMEDDYFDVDASQKYYALKADMAK
jgi:hypothetical protein